MEKVFMWTIWILGIKYKKGISVKMPKRKEIVSYARRNADSAKRVGSVSEAENAESGQLVYIKEF